MRAHQPSQGRGGRPQRRKRTKEEGGARMAAGAQERGPFGPDSENGLQAKQRPGKCDLPEG